MDFLSVHTSTLSVCLIIIPLKRENSKKEVGGGKEAKPFGVST